MAAAKAAEAEKARQAAEAKVADAEKARQAASKTADDAEKARQAATAKATEADKARQAAEARAAEATDATAKSAQARQAAEAHATEADKARQAAEAKAAGPVPSGSASSSGQFSRRSNMEAKGGTRLAGWVPAASIIDCEQNCARSNTCKVYSYYKNGTACFLYSVADLSPNEDFDSGILATATSGMASPSGQFSRRSNMEIAGNPIWNQSSRTIFSRPSSGDCELSCAEHDDCNAFSYSKLSRTCYLYGSRSVNLVANENYDSGIRN